MAPWVGSLVSQIPTSTSDKLIRLLCATAGRYSNDFLMLVLYVISNVDPWIWIFDTVSESIIQPPSDLLATIGMPTCHNMSNSLRHPNCFLSNLDGDASDFSKPKKDWEKFETCQPHCRTCRSRAGLRLTDKVPLEPGCAESEKQNSTQEQFGGTVYPHSLASVDQCMTLQDFSRRDRRLFTD